jgi:PKD repeat protein
VVPTTGAAPLPVTFDGSSSTDPDRTITSWDLAFGDDTPDATGSGTPPAGITHTYAAAGTYTATLSVGDSNGQSAATTAQVVVTLTPPTAQLAVAPGSGAAPLPVAFDGSSSTDPDGIITSWDLAFGDDTPDATGSGTPPAGITDTYAAAGTYTATLSVGDSKRGERDVKCADRQRRSNEHHRVRSGQSSSVGAISSPAPPSACPVPDSLSNVQFSTRRPSTPTLL